MKKTILSDNVQAAVFLSDAFTNALGPEGMNKLLVDNLGDSYVTNDGATIIDKMEVKHPIAKLILETGKTMEEEIGDGTKTAIILTGELLKQAQKLISKGMHPTMIIKGYRKALKDALNILTKKTVKGTLSKLVSTVMKGTDVPVLEAVKETPTQNVLILKKTGKRIETQVINGVVIDKERVHPRMPEKISKARILITKTPLEVKTTETSAEIIIKDPSQLKSFLERETNTIKAIISSIKSSGANAVLCQKGIDDKAQEMLAREGILGIRRIRESDINALLKATKARLVSDLLNINPSDLGTGSIRTEKIGDERLTIISECPGNVKTIIVRGSTEQVANEIERSVNKALGVINTIRKDERYVQGAGITEVMLQKELMKNSLQGKERISYEAFAQALKKIRQTLERNTGELSKDVIEPLSLKTQALTSATETVVMILRIDGVLRAK
jgi:chaperonin GroEL (HSP60 family)